VIVSAADTASASLRHSGGLILTAGVYAGTSRPRPRSPRKIRSHPAQASWQLDRFDKLEADHQALAPGRPTSRLSLRPSASRSRRMVPTRRAFSASEARCRICRVAPAAAALSGLPP
jgi:hypothetical protein